MKIDFIKRGDVSRLILIFAGWSTDARYYIDCVAEGWDTAVVSDYRDLVMPSLPEQYSTIYIFAYSLGVWAAEQSDIRAAARIAIYGTPLPVSDEYGIPEAVYRATANGLNVKSLKKFHLRMAGDKTSYESIAELLPSSPDIENLREELYSIFSNAFSNKVSKNIWDRAYIADNDRIVPTASQERYWSHHPEVVKVKLRSAHAACIKDIIKECIPDHKRIGEGFERAISTYNDNAVIQSEICERIGLKLRELLADRDNNVKSLLEVGVGNGLMTEVWRKIVIPRIATYIDLHSMSEFGIAEEERYLTTDAEDWLEKSVERFDVILSASTIQWFADPVKFIDTVKHHLYPGGFAIISTFVKGNLKELDSLRPAPLIYRSAEEYLMVKVTEGECFERILEFPTSREMMMHLRNTGVTQKRQSLGKDIEKGNSYNAKPWSKFPCKLTYKPMILTIRNI